MCFAVHNGVLLKGDCWWFSPPVIFLFFSSNSLVPFGEKRGISFQRKPRLKHMKVMNKTEKMITVKRMDGNGLVWVVFFFSFLVSVG